MSAKCLEQAGLGLALASCLAGCASGPGQSVDQVVRVETPGCVASQCTLRNDMGRWDLGTVPGEIQVKTSRQPLEVSCVADGHRAHLSTPVEPLRPVDGRSGALGAGVGAGVTAATFAPALATPLAPVAGVMIAVGAVAGAGAGRAIDASQRGWRYPATLSVPMDCEAATIEQAVWGMAVEGSPDDGALRVTRLAPGGRAAAAGLRPGDLILSVNGAEVLGTPSLASRLQTASRPIALRVVGGDRQERTVMLDDRPPR
jgi:membrane-associated protease RseP (regulator of RpoE activity)